jgi:hypothetical protein
MSAAKVRVQILCTSGLLGNSNHYAMLLVVAIGDERARGLSYCSIINQLRVI